MRLVHIIATLDNNKRVFNRSIAYNTKKVPNKNELSLKSDGRNGYVRRLSMDQVDRIVQARSLVTAGAMIFSVWCRESEAAEWEMNLDLAMAKVSNSKNH